MTLLSCILMRSRNLKPFYPLQRSFYSHQTWQPNDLREAALTHRVTTFRVSMATNSNRMMTYLQGFLPIKSNHTLIMWSSGIIWQTKTITSPMPQYLWPPSLAVWGLILSGPTHKFIVFRVSLAIKRGKMMTYLQWLLPIKLHEALIK